MPQSFYAAVDAQGVAGYSARRVQGQALDEIADIVQVGDPFQQLNAKCEVAPGWAYRHIERRLGGVELS